MNDKQALAQIVLDELLKHYGTPKWTKLDGVSELVSTILSQNTNDGNRDLAYSRLRVRFRTWEDVRDADPEAVIDAIRPAGLANQKGPRIQAALSHITRQRGKLNIDFLAELPVKEAQKWLMSIHGVGPKTTADEAHEIMKDLCPVGAQGPFHLNIIYHGREICHARKPECERCPLTPWCEHFKQNKQ